LRGDLSGGCETSLEDVSCLSDALEENHCPQHDCIACGTDCGVADCNCPQPDCAEGPPLTKEELCGLLELDKGLENLRDIYRFAWQRATALVSGEILEVRVAQGGTPYARMKIEKIPYGWSFLEGTEAWIPIPAEMPEPSVGSFWTAALSSNRPSLWESEGMLTWGNLLALIPQSEAATLEAEPGYERYCGTVVAEARILSQDETRTTFEVENVLLGTMPGQFYDNWFSSWGLSYPPVSETLYLVTVRGLSQVGDGGPWVGTVEDFRPSTDAARQALLALLPKVPTAEEMDSWVSPRQRFHDSVAFNTSLRVLSSYVTGRADECCTGAGGTYIAHGVSEYLKGMLPSPAFVTGGHAYYGQEKCGEGYLVGLATYIDPAPLVDPPFDCQEYPNTRSWEAWVPLESMVTIQWPYSDKNLADVKLWVDASPPIYRLFGPGEEVDAEEVIQRPDNAPWSMPLSTIDVLRFASDMAIITVKQVGIDEATGYNRVSIETTFSLYEYEHIARYEFDLVFECGDPRLLQVGSRWVAGLVRPNRSAPPDEEVNMGRVFMIPGALLPAWAVSTQLEMTLLYKPW